MSHGTRFAVVETVCALPFGEVKGASHYDIDKFMDLEEGLSSDSSVSVCGAWCRISGSDWSWLDEAIRP